MSKQGRMAKPAPEPEDLAELLAEHEGGWLWKRGGHVPTWKRRFFRLRSTPDCGVYLDYFADEPASAAVAPAPKGSIPIGQSTSLLSACDVHLLDTANLGNTQGWPAVAGVGCEFNLASRFGIVTPQRTYWLQSAEPRARDEVVIMTTGDGLRDIPREMEALVIKDMAEPLLSAPVANSWLGLLRKVLLLGLPAPALKPPKADGLKGKLKKALLGSESGPPRETDPDLWRTTRCFFDKQALQMKAVVSPKLPS